MSDGSAGDVDYARYGDGYSRYRRPEPAIAARVRAALGDVSTVVNVGAGAGSYEPDDLVVTAVEPSGSMRAQRPAGRPAVDAPAEDLPFADDAFDAAIATFTVHQWGDLEAGLAELRRVATGPVAILTCDPARLSRFWLAEYAPEVIETEARRYPSLGRLCAALPAATVEPVPIPWGCVDGFGEAYYGRPEALLDPGARHANSAWSFVDPSLHARFERALGADLEDRSWDRRWGHLRTRPTFDGSLVLVVDPGQPV